MIPADLASYSFLLIKRKNLNDVLSYISLYTRVCTLTSP